MSVGILICLSHLLGADFRFFWGAQVSTFFSFTWSSFKSREVQRFIAGAPRIWCCIYYRVCFLRCYLPQIQWTLLTSEESVEKEKKRLLEFLKQFTKKLNSTAERCRPLHETTLYIIGLQYIIIKIFIVFDCVVCHFCWWENLLMIVWYLFADWAFALILWVLSSGSSVKCHEMSWKQWGWWLVYNVSILFLFLHYIESQNTELDE